MLKISYAGCLGLSLVISAQFTLKVCVAARNHEKFTKIYNLGGLGSFKVIDADKINKPVASACYDKQRVILGVKIYNLSTTVFTLEEPIAAK